MRPPPSFASPPRFPFYDIRDRLRRKLRPSEAGPNRILRQSDTDKRSRSFSSPHFDIRARDLGLTVHPLIEGMTFLNHDLLISERVVAIFALIPKAHFELDGLDVFRFAPRTADVRWSVHSSPSVITGVLQHRLRMLLQPLRNVQRRSTIVQRIMGIVTGTGQIRIPIIRIELGEPCRLNQLLPGPILGPFRLFSVMGRVVIHDVYRPLALIEGDPRRLQKIHVET